MKRDDKKRPSNGKPKNSENIFEQIVSEVSEKGKKLFSGSLEDAKDVIEENASLIKEKASEFKDKTMDELSAEARTQVRHNPLQSVAVAFGIGLLLGFFLKSKD